MCLQDYELSICTPITLRTFLSQDLRQVVWEDSIDVFSIIRLLILSKIKSYIDVCEDMITEISQALQSYSVHAQVGVGDPRDSLFFI